MLSGAVPRFVTLHEPEGDGAPWTFDPDELRAAFGPKTRGLVLNTPHNPTGKVFTRGELEFIASLAIEHDVIVFTDDIYEHIVYRGAHVPLATLPGMAERTVTISGIGKTYSVTGWRVGWSIAPARLSAAIRKVHDFLTVGAAAPLQAAAAVALDLPEGYYDDLVRDYTRKRTLLLEGLARAGFRFAPPEGAYYVMADITPFGLGDDTQFARHLVETLGVAVVPGTSFYPDGGQGRDRVRFSFPKRMDTLQRAAERLARLGAAQP